MFFIFSNCFLALLLFTTVECWRAVPANQAMYAMRAKDAGVTSGWPADPIVEYPIRDTIHSIYKFGWCSPDSTQRHYRKKTANLTLATWQDTHTSYLYMLVNKNSQKFDLQCVKMTAYSPRQYQFRKSRLPIYYCQGQIHYLMMNTIQRIEIHELYFHQRLNVPLNFVFDFYHPPKI